MIWVADWGVGAEFTLRETTFIGRADMFILLISTHKQILFALRASGVAELA